MSKLVPANYNKYCEVAVTVANLIIQVSQNDCYAHSAEFTPGLNTVRPLSIQTDTWCSSGAFAADGTLVQTGGDFDGANKIRYFKPCAPGVYTNY